MNDNDERRKMTEHCMQKKSMVVNPIIDWEHNDVWNFLNSEKVETNVLYECGYKRIGCIGCPMAQKQRWKQFADFPKFKQAYIKAFNLMLEVRKARELETSWQSGEDVFLWWMEDTNVPGQIRLEL